MKKQIKAMFLAGILATGFSLDAGWRPFDFTPEDGAKYLVIAALTTMLASASEAGKGQFTSIFGSTGAMVHETASWLKQKTYRTVKGYGAAAGLCTYQDAFIQDVKEFEVKIPAEFEHVSQNATLDPRISNIIDEINSDKNKTCPLITCAGITGSGKTQSAEMIAHSLQATLYQIPATYLRKYSNDDHAKRVMLDNFAQWISFITPNGKRAVIDLEEFGAEFLAANPNNFMDIERADVWKDWTAKVTGDKKRLSAYPKIIFVTTTNTPLADMDDAIKGRIKYINMQNPDDAKRADFFKKSTINIEQNAILDAQEKLKRIPTQIPGPMEYLQSLFKSKSNEELNAEKNAYLKKEYLVTDAMITAAQNNHTATIVKYEQEKQAFNTPWTFTSLFLSPYWFQKTLLIKDEQKIIAAKQKDFERKGSATPIVTPELTDMNDDDAKFLAIKTKTLNGQESSLRDLNGEIIDKAQTQEIKFITDIKDHLGDDRNNTTVTQATNPELFKQLYLHQKYCASTLSTADNVDQKKDDAKVKPDQVASYTINPDNRTYTPTLRPRQAVGEEADAGAGVGSGSDDTSIQRNVAPIQFGAITKSHLAAAAYGDTFKQYEAKDAAAGKIANAWKANKFKIVPSRASASSSSKANRAYRRPAFQDTDKQTAYRAASQASKIKLQKK